MEDKAEVIAARTIHSTRFCIGNLKDIFSHGKVGPNCSSGVTTNKTPAVMRSSVQKTFRVPIRNVLPTNIFTGNEVMYGAENVKN